MRARALAISFLVACGDDDGVAPPLPEVTDPAALVDPTIGSGGLGYNYGSCFVGAAAPHGLVKLGPDTNGSFGTVSFLHYSGYFADDDRIQGFSHFHLHGAGATDYGVLSVMPTLAFDPAKTTVVDYETHFDKTTEHASAGRYDVTLDGGIAVSLTATQRAAVHRYSMPAAGAIVIDLAKTLSGGMVDAATISIDDVAGEVTGQLHHLGAMSNGFGGYTVYFVAKTSAPWTAHWVWAAGAAASHDAMATGTGVGGALEVPAGDTQLAVGVSLVSLAGARANLAAEVPAIDLDAVAAATREAWTQKLSTVLITGGTDVQRRIFYTSLYHAFLMPSVIDDVDGSYQLAGQPVTTAVGYHQMSDLSLWDTYRTVSSLYAWLVPASAHDSARSLVGFGNGLGAYPKWPLAIGETGTMLGASAEIVIADTVARGIADAGGDVAWPMLRAAAMDPAAPATERGGRNDVVDYMTHGYVSNANSTSVSMTTEYAHDDFALAQLAAALGQTADHDALIERSHGWRALYDPSVGFLRGKNPDGTFPTTAYDPTSMTDDYAEANGWQSLWMTGLHDPEGIAMVLGGNDAAVAKLESFFEMAQQDWDNADPSAVNFPRPYYWHGNEPDLNAPFVFAQLGRPDLTQQWVRWVLDTQYTDQPDGVAGNDDGGAMGSWYVLAALGVYPISGADGYVIGAPRFPKARVIVGGHELAIVADGVSDSAMYVQSVDLDGTPITSLKQSDLATASTLHFVMTP